jgi:hypothetical protein
LRILRDAKRDQQVARVVIPGDFALRNRPRPEVPDGVRSRSFRSQALKALRKGVGSGWGMAQRYYCCSAASLTDIETDWHRGVAYVGMSRARRRLRIILRLQSRKSSV